MKRIALPLAALLLVMACGTTSHIFPGRRFDRTRGCLDPFSSIDVLDGTNPGSLCMASCLVGRATDGGEPVIYVSSECAPFPPFYDLSAADPDCARAVAAYTQGPACLADGGVGEGGAPDAGAADSAATDAAGDGAADSATADAAADAADAADAATD